MPRGAIIKQWIMNNTIPYGIDKHIVTSIVSTVTCRAATDLYQSGKVFLGNHGNHGMYM